MKKIYFLLIAGTILSFSTRAQESDLKPFKMDISLGYAIPGGSGAKGGILFAFEPKYAVLSKLSVGVRIEAAVVARFNGYDQYGEFQDASVKASASYLATADYYFMDNYRFRPFAGVGAGIFSLAGYESSTDNYSSGNKFGGMIRAGMEISHFRIGFEYNIVPNTTFSGYDNNGDPVNNLTSKNSYIGIKFGVCLGGGPR
jgi:hypothetical protein